MPCGVRKPNAFPVVSFALPMNPSTTPERNAAPAAGGAAVT